MNFERNIVADKEWRDNVRSDMTDAAGPVVLHKNAIIALLDHIDALEGNLDSEGFITIPVRAKWIIERDEPVDWACIECRPDSDVLVAGFQCYFHQAKAALTKAEEREND